MIKVNLTPVDELENQYWYVPDLVVAVIVVVASYFGAQYYLGTVRDEIAQVQGRADELKGQVNSLKRDLEQVSALDREIAALDVKIKALDRITESRIQKYKPVIVLEHLQNLRPEGVWFKELEITKAKKFKLVGQAFDNILVAEMMTSLKRTETQDSDPTDLRTQVYLTEISLEATEMVKTQDTAFPELGKFPQFTLNGDYAERGETKKEKGPEDTVGGDYEDLARGAGAHDETRM